MIVTAPDADQALACVAAALIDERDVLRGRPDELPVDLAWRVRVVCGDARDDRADPRVIDRLRDRALDLARRAGVTLRFTDVDVGRCGAVLALGFPDRLAVRRRQPGQFQLRSGGGAWMAPTDELAGETFVVAADLDGDRAQARIRLAAGLSAAEVEASMGHLVERRTTLTWDATRDDLVERTEVRLGAMLVSEASRPPSAGPATVAALVERVRATRLGILQLGAAAQLRARVAALRALDGDGWPDWSDRALLASLDDWLAPYLTHAAGRADLSRLDVAMLLANQLDWDRQVDLAEQAPPTLTTASGRSVVIDWTRDHPTASVRVQDLFGTSAHPTVARGRIALTLELLSPADRPLQITTDLPGFWRGSWADVRKEMAGRYPKHQWPIDPAAAPPTRLKRDS
jgi:ATP-dependent helicase HrpB